MACGFWQASVPLSVLSDEESEPLQSGLGTMVSAPGNPEMKCCFGPIAPVEALPCSNEEAKGISVKREET